MATSHVSTFETSLDDLGVTWRRTDAEGFGDVLADVVDEPAVGVPLPFEDVSLDDAPVSIRTDPTPADLEASETGVTPVAFGVADYGSVVIRGTQTGEEPVSLFPEHHVAVVAESDVVPDMPAAFERLVELDAEGSGGLDAVIATGASATADMGALVHGVHGPTEVTVIVVEDR